MVKHRGQFAPDNKLAAGPRSPRGRFITQRLISMMHEEINVDVLDPKDPKHKKMLQRRATRLNFFCEKLFDLALGGDMQALKYIADRIEGTPIQTTIMAEEFDPMKLEAERKRLDEQRANLANMTDAERTALYFQTLRQVPGSSVASRSN